MPFGRQSQRGGTRGDITQEPEEGWLHDDNALMIGDGFFYSYPVEFLGSVEINHSMSDVPLEARTAIVRYLMQRLLVETKRFKKLGKPPKNYEAFCEGLVVKGEVPVSFGIAADGMVVVLNNPEHQASDAQPPLLFYHSMPMISIATGGDKESYDLCSYVAKDGQGKRCAYIFNCGELSDEVLATLGQSFVLAQEVAQKQRERPPADTLKAGYLEVTDDDAYGDLSGMGLPAGMDAAVSAVPEYDIAADVIQQDPDYDNPGDLTGRIVASGAYEGGPEAPVAEPLYDTATDRLVSTLNARTSVRRSMRASVRASRKGKGKKGQPEVAPEEVHLNAADQEDLSRPSWVCISETAKEATAGQDLGALLSQFKAQNIEEDDE